LLLQAWWWSVLASDSWSTQACYQGIGVGRGPPSVGKRSAFTGERKYSSMH